MFGRLHRYATDCSRNNMDIHVFWRITEQGFSRPLFGRWHRYLTGCKLRYAPLCPPSCTCQAAHETDLHALQVMILCCHVENACNSRTLFGNTAIRRLSCTAACDPQVGIVLRFV